MTTPPPSGESQNPSLISRFTSPSQQVFTITKRRASVKNMLAVPTLAVHAANRQVEHGYVDLPLSQDAKDVARIPAGLHQDLLKVLPDPVEHHPTTHLHAGLRHVREP